MKGRIGARRYGETWASLAMNELLSTFAVGLVALIGPWYLALIVAMWAYNFIYPIMLRRSAYRDRMDAWGVFRSRLRDRNLYAYFYLLSSVWPFLFLFILVVRLSHQIKHS